MKIYIEVLIIVALIIIFLLWMIWNSFSRGRLKKKYKTENDKSNKGGEQNAEIEGTEQRVGTDGAEQRTVQKELRGKVEILSDLENLKDERIYRRYLLQMLERQAVATERMAEALENSLKEEEEPEDNEPEK